jgi:hypothetical protein
MGEFGRILTNLGLAYGLMNKDQFVDLVARYAQDKDMSEEKMMGLVENLFEELEITHKRRQAKQMFEAFEMKKRSDDPESADFFDEMHQAAASGMGASADVAKELRKLRKAVKTLTEALSKKDKSE